MTTMATMTTMRIMPVFPFIQNVMKVPLVLFQKYAVTHFWGVTHGGCVPITKAGKERSAFGKKND